MAPVGPRLLSLLLGFLLVVAGCAESQRAEPLVADTTGNSPVTTSTESAGSEDPTPRFELTNGLRVIITPIPEATTTAVVLMFDVGSYADPPNRSGLAHFAEHLLVTSSTSAEPARTVDDVANSYPLGWNAQTGADYTVVASVVAPEDLSAELTLMAARLAGPSPTSDDLERERPRILAETSNMFGGIASLGVVNAAKEQLLPTPDGGRRGGDTAALADITLEELAAWLAFYNPTTATLSVSGPVDIGAVAAAVGDAFGPLPAGAQPPLAAEATPGSAGVATVEAAAAGPALVAVAYAVAAPTSPDYPVLLVAALRLFTAAPAAGHSVSYGPIDDPSALVVSAPMLAAEAAVDAAERLAAQVRRIVSAPLEVGETDDVIVAFGPLLGLSANPANPYGTAFAAARAVQLDIDSSALEDAVAGLTAVDYQAAIAEMFVAVELTGAATASSS